MSALARYLGLAFAAADLLIEVNETQRVVFALGAGDSSFKGRRLAELVSPADRSKLESLFDGLRPGERRGPVELSLLADGGAARPARLSAFVLPDLRPHVSCALSWIAEPKAAAGPKLDPEAFRATVRDLLEVAGARGGKLSLALVEIKGLIEARRNLSAADMAALLAQIQALMAQYGADGAATELSEERFAIIHERPNDLDGLLQALGKVSDSSGSNLEVAGQALQLSPKHDPLQQYRAVRTALDSFISAGLPKDEASLRRSFAAVLDQTARSASRLGEIMDTRRFDLLFQPIVELATETALHHEVLVRFEREAGPASMIKLAEDLAMIERLDAMIAEQAVKRLRAPGADRLKLAVNVSGATLLSDAFLERLLNATSGGQALRSRLHLEITESAALQDLEAASRRIRGLRDAGFEVAIDDFGAGAASFEYLRALPVNAVKIDGRFVRGVDRDERAQSLIKHFVSLCNELRYITVAEMIEREEELSTVSALGVACGQGWLFGRPEPEPRAPVRKTTVRARRMGEREQWG